MNSRPHQQHSAPQALQDRIAEIEGRETGQASLARAIREVHLHGAAAVGDAYFPAVVRDMARVLGADFVFIGKLLEERHAVETISVCAGGEIVDNMTYDLEGTPCDVVLGRGSCVYPNEVVRAFPDDQLLIDMRIKGYVGVPLVSDDGKPSGLIVALYRGVVPDPEFASTLILVFAARTAAEIDRVKRDEEARILEDQLLRTQKLESLGVLACGLAHDFNNLLSSMLGSADLAMNQLPEGHRACEHLSVIQGAATDAGELCRQLLAYAGKGRFEVVPADLSDIVQDQEKLLRSSISKSASLHLDLARELPACHADIAQLRQILLNLVVNASESLPEDGGIIRVTTGHGSFDADYLTSTDLKQHCEPGEYVFLEVSDTGSGMTPEVRANLFDPFYTTKLTGRGLGLAAILGIVKGHKGCIKVYSEPGDGSSFKILLPASSERAASMERVAPDEPWRASGLALLVDDDEQVSEVCSMMLEAIGFEPLLASNGPQAIELYKERFHELKVVMLDLTMPGMNGDEVFREMRKIDTSVPVVLTSGFNEQDTVQNFVGRGLAGFLQKPVRLEEMRKKLRAALESRSGSED